MCQPPPVSLSSFLGNLARQLQALPLRVPAASEESVTHMKANTELTDSEDGARHRTMLKRPKGSGDGRLLLSREPAHKLRKHKVGLDPGDRESEQALQAH